MKVVIDIPEEILRTIRENDVGNIIYKAIKNGTPLPKGHGRLIDENELCEGRVSNDPVVIAAKCAHATIEADKANEEADKASE